ncbi:MAG: hypothetical protein OXH96_12635 [Spirochaetaceae bacterium]|nr:hypothetical protein [Spirochaetaceae bacterium]
MLLQRFGYGLLVRSIRAYYFFANYHHELIRVLFDQLILIGKEVLERPIKRLDLSAMY